MNCVSDAILVISALGQILDIRIPTVSLEELGIKNLDLTTAESSWEGIDSVKGAISYISSVRSRLGAYQNRLEHTMLRLPFR